MDVAENTTTVTTVVASDPNAGDTLSFAISGGVDQAKFTLDNGVLAFRAAPDFEAPGDDSGDNIYNVTVMVSDGKGGSDTQALTVTVTNAAENSAPAITTPDTASVAENTTAVIDIAASDNADSEGSGLGYAITGGADAAFFDLDADTGALAFRAAPDFEAPGDDNTDNVYRVEVTVTDSGGLTGVQNLAVTVTDAAENRDPVLAGDLSITVPGSGSVTLTQADLTASDTESGDADLVFAVADAVNGHLALAGALGTAITSFTQAQLTAGNVSFVHDGSGAGRFEVTVSDGDGGDAGPVTVIATIAAVNRAATGAPTISDTSPTESQVLSAATGAIQDADGMSANFGFQWQNLVGGAWTNIAGPSRRLSPRLNWPPFRPDTRLRQGGLGISSGTGLCRTTTRGSKSSPARRAGVDGPPRRSCGSSRRRFAPGRAFRSSRAVMASRRTCSIVGGG